MNKRVIVRTLSNLSFSGEQCPAVSPQTYQGILLKTSPRSGIKIWIPANEVKSVILPNGEEIKGTDYNQWSS